MKVGSGLTATLFLLVFAIGCGRFTGTTNTGNSAGSNSANTAPVKAVKAVDVPALIGKSVEEVKKTLGPPTSELAGRMTWEFEQGEFDVEPKYKDEKKVDHFSFDAKIFVVNGQTAQGYPDYQRLGDLIGVETRGKTPTSAETGDTATVTFEKFDMGGGKTVDEISFRKVLGSFRSVTIRPVRGY